MSCGSRPEVWTLALSLTVTLAAPASAQGWHETQLWAVALTSRPPVYAAGLGLAWRDAGRTRIGVAVAGGVAEGSRAAGRAELAWHFLLDPGKRAGMSVYGGGGVALTLVQAARMRPFLQVLLGVESAPAGRHGWFLEGGFGGGARVATGLRFRTRHTNAPSR